MTVPVVASLSRLYPEDRFVIVSKKDLADMFYGMSNVIFHEAHLSTNPRTVIQVYKELRARYDIDVVIDLQRVPRTRLIGWLFHLHKARVYTIRYGRVKKYWVTRNRNRRVALPTEFDRYREVLHRAGLKTDCTFEALPVRDEARRVVEQRFGHKEGRWIGIAPFAKSKSNMLPYRITKELIMQLNALPDTRIFLFGAGKIECEMLSIWASLFERVESVAGQLLLREELELMRQLDVMICMDSANQHLSSLVGLRAISIWCGTHPQLGFYGWKQDPNDIIQRNELRCRPCTIHGTNHCPYRNFACREITSEEVLNKLKLENKTYE